MSSRIQRDGNYATEKAQELKKTKNLEVPKVNNIIHGFSNSFQLLTIMNYLRKQKMQALGWATILVTVMKLSIISKVLK
jgi:hypothetical protein